MGVPTRNEVTKTHEFPAGIYVVGDPCYTISEADWLAMLDETGYFGYKSKRESDGTPVNNWDSGAYIYKGNRCWTHSTYFGDGEYRVKSGSRNIGNLGVDSGEIGIIPIEVMENIPAAIEGGFVGSLVYHFQEPFYVFYSDGVFYIGDLRIDTK